MRALCEVHCVMAVVWFPTHMVCNAAVGSVGCAFPTAFCSRTYILACANLQYRVWLVYMTFLRHKQDAVMDSLRTLELSRSCFGAAMAVLHCSMICS
jgi:hypothetical protein